MVFTTVASHTTTASPTARMGTLVAAPTPIGLCPAHGATMTTLEILIEARRLLAKGWCQDTCQVIVGGEVTARDMVTALNDAAGGRGMLSVGSPEQKRAYELVWLATWERGIIAFNDHPHTTQGMVLFVFDSCIASEISTEVQSLTAEHRSVEA
jgi:hypothetical protein